MYSISSIDNDYYRGSCYDSGFRGAENVPIYPYVGGQPLVYYSHIAQDSRPQRNKIGKKNNPNCFVKAFRWYTQELPSPQLVAPCNNNVNIGGFAAWLDKKYEEYLHDSRCQNDCQQYRSKQCSITKSDRTINRLEYTPRTRRFPRLKSPWKRKRRYINETERDTLCEKQSFEFILRPQDLSRPASECCQKTSYCVRSDTTFVTSKSAIPTKIKKKSISVICITKPKEELESDIKITKYDVSQCNKRQTSEEISKIVTDLTAVRNQKQDFKLPIKPNTKYIICDCYNRDLESGMHYDNVAATRNQNITVNCQCAMKNVSSENEKYKAFKKVSHNELHENEYHVNKSNIKTRRSEEETRIVTEHAEVTLQKQNSTSPMKLNTEVITCACDQLHFKNLSPRGKEASRRNCYKTVICQCSKSNFQKDESCQRNESNVSNIFGKISRNDFYNNEYDENKLNMKKQTSDEKNKVVTKYTEQTNKKQNRNLQVNRKSRDVICECKQDTLDLNNVMTQYKVARKVYNKTFNCQCTGVDSQTDKDRRHFDNKEQYTCRKVAQEIYQTCCQCPQPLEPRLHEIPQIRETSKNLSVVKTLKYKELLYSKELPVHSVQTSDHSIRFQEDSFFVRLI